MEDFDQDDQIEAEVGKVKKKRFSGKELFKEFEAQKFNEGLSLEATRLVKAEKVVSKEKLKAILREIISDYDFQAKKAKEIKKALLDKKIE